MCTRQSQKVTWDTINTLFLTLLLSNRLLLLSFSIRKHTSMAFRAILSNFFEEHWIQKHPQYLSGLMRALFPTTFLEIPEHHPDKFDSRWRHIRNCRGRLGMRLNFPLQKDLSWRFELLPWFPLMNKIGISWFESYWNISGEISKLMLTDLSKINHFNIKANVVWKKLVKTIKGMSRFL